MKRSCGSEHGVEREPGHFEHATLANCQRHRWQCALRRSGGDLTPVRQGRLVAASASVTTSFTSRGGKVTVIDEYPAASVAARAVSGAPFGGHAAASLA